MQWYEPVVIARFNEDSRIQVQDPWVPDPGATWAKAAESGAAANTDYRDRCVHLARPENGGGGKGKGKGKPTGGRRRAGVGMVPGRPGIDVGGWWGRGVQASERYSRRWPGRTDHPPAGRPARAGGSQVHAAPATGLGACGAVPCRAVRASA